MDFTLCRDCKCARIFRLCIYTVTCLKWLACGYASTVGAENFGK
jgi:hypothetical protein